MHVPQNVTLEIALYNMNCKNCDLGVRFDSKLSFSEHINEKLIKLIAFLVSLKEFCMYEHFYFTL